MNVEFWLLVFGVGFVGAILGAWFGRFPLLWRIGRLESAILSEQRQRASGVRWAKQGDVKAAQQFLGFPQRSNQSLEEIERRALAGDDSPHP